MEGKIKEIVDQANKEMIRNEDLQTTVDEIVDFLLSLDKLGLFKGKKILEAIKERRNKMK